MNKDEIRELRRKRLMDSKAYQAMSSLTRYKKHTKPLGIPYK